MNAFRLRFPVLAAGFLLSAVALRAHPGHALREASPAHLFTSPDHLAVLALGGVALWFTARLVQRRWPRLLLRSAGAAAILTAAVLWGIRA